MIISQLDQTRMSLPHFLLGMLDAWKSCTQRPFFGLNGFSHTSRACKTLRVALRPTVVFYQSATRYKLTYTITLLLLY